MSFVWTEFLATGNEKMDIQRRKLLEEMNYFFTAITDEKADKEVERLFTYLDGFVTGMFFVEESLLRSNNYPDFPIHKAQHDFFRKSYAHMRNEYEMRGVNETLIGDLHKKIFVWLLNHITKEDMQWVAFIKNKDDKS